ncbi:MAG: response regulator [Henriciella sp.]|uniref:response regulator n=1 Tax=Henriciella sp. TaxID=1968823 RepID=UPI003C789FBA
MSDEKTEDVTGYRLLIVEDEVLLVMDLEMFFEEQGIEVLEPARNIQSALAALETERPDVVTLDMNLNGESSAPVAAVLKEQNIPFVIISGYTGTDAEAPDFQHAPMVKKPYDPKELLRTITSLLS